MTKYHIYPKQFRSAKIPIEKNRCFMLMPFQSDFDLGYGTLKQALQENGYVCTRADEVSGSSPIVSNVLNELLKAHFVIADLTGRNANVFYELGIAHSFKDAQNIVLIAQSSDDIPFDIQHLRTIIYSPDNYKFLTASVLKTLEENKAHFSFYESLQKKGIIGVIGDNVDDFLNYIQVKFADNLHIMASLLDGDNKDYDNNEIERLLRDSIGLIYATASDKYSEYLDGIIQLFSALIVSCGPYKITSSIVYEFLHQNRLVDYYLPENEVLSYQTETALCLASRRICFTECMEWIIDYLSRSKSATIDLNRHRIERFLMTSKDEKVDQLILDSLFNNNNYIREHMADIIGEKQINGGDIPLARQLDVEVNNFTAVSIVAALGKYKDAKLLPVITDWFLEREQTIREQEHFFIVRHVYTALKRINCDEGKSLIQRIRQEYEEHLIGSSVI